MMEVFQTAAEAVKYARENFGGVVASEKHNYRDLEHEYTHRVYAKGEDPKPKSEKVGCVTTHHIIHPIETLSDEMILDYCFIDEFRDYGVPWRAKYERAWYPGAVRGSSKYMNGLKIVDGVSR